MYTLEGDAQALRTAMKGFGTDSNALIKIIANRTNEYRQKLKITFKTMFGRDLISDLKSETSGNFEDAIVALFYTPIDFDCFSLYKAMKGLGTNEDTLIEIIGSRSPSVLRQIVKRYKELYNIELEAHLKKEISGAFLRIMVALIQGMRSENNRPSEEDMKAKAKQLFDAGEGKWGTDDSVFNKIFATASPMEMVYISREYHKLTGRTILQAIDSEFSGNICKLYKTLICAQISPSEYFATRLYDSMKGAGTRDTQLIRIIVTRDEIDMPLIKKFYKQIYKVDLLDDIKGDCSGNYRKLLIELADH